MTDVKDADGFMRRTVTLNDEGALAIKGQDLGPRVERIFGFTEYEFERRLTLKQTAKLRKLLGASADDDLLILIEDRFKSAGDLEDFVQEHGIAGKLWNRIGD